MDETNPPVQTTPTDETTTTPEVASSRFSNKSLKITIILVVLLILATVTAFAYSQIVLPENSLFGQLNSKPTPTATPTLAPTATPAITPTPTPTLVPKPTLAMMFQEIVTANCKEISLPNGGSSHTFETAQLPITINDSSITYTNNSCWILSNGMGGIITQELSNGLMLELINDQTIEPGHDSPSLWSPLGKEIYAQGETKLYAYLSLGGIGPGSAPDETYLDIRGIKNITLSNGEKITAVISFSPLIDKNNAELTAILSKYTKVIDAPIYDAYGITVVDTSKSDQYYEEIYTTFLQDITKSSAAIQTTYNSVLDTLNAIEGE